ncbi:MAG: M14 family metallopeptidase [Chloroflexota bacterium]
MKIINQFGLAVVCLICAGCQTAAVPTPTQPPTVTRQQIATQRPTQTPRPVDITTTLVVTPSRTALPTVTQPPTATTPPLDFTPAPVPDANISTIGQSVDERNLVVHEFGSGGSTILLVGGIHGGWEANTIVLMNELIDHFAANPTDILPEVSLHIVPVMNPDGAATGSDLDSRFNANNVDLNRNWACGWQAEAVWRDVPVDAGAGPFSEPETRAVAAYVERVNPQAALFYHSAAGGVFAGNCDQRPGEWRSGRLEAIYGEVAGYTYGETFSAYPVTGTAPSWADGLGIASVDVELLSARNSEFERNLRAVIAVQCWVAGPDAAQNRLCAP